MERNQACWKGWGLGIGHIRKKWSMLERKGLLGRNWGTLDRNGLVGKDGDWKGMRHVRKGRGMIEKNRFVGKEC